MTPVRLEPAATQSRVKHSTTEPLCFHSDVMFCYKVIRELKSMDHLCINPNLRIEVYKLMFYFKIVNKI